MADSIGLQLVLVRFVRTSPTDYDVREVLQGLVKESAAVLAAGIGLMSSGEAGRVQSVAASTAEIGWLETLQAKLGEGPAVRACRTAEQVMVPDLAAGYFPVFAPRALAAGVGGVYSFPVRRGDDVLGAFTVYAETGGELTEEDKAAGQVLADVAAGYLGNSRARGDAEKAQDEMRSRAEWDTLTGLANRPLFLHRVQSALTARLRHGTQVAVLMVDVDRFRLVNDSLGRQCGDRVLSDFARRLRGLVRPGDVVARVGGDEFAVLCERLPTPKALTVVADLSERILAALAAPLDIDGREIVLSVSIGAALSQGRQPADTLLNQADTAMNRAKSLGKARYALFDRTIRARATGRLQAESDLRLATKGGQLRLDYQPIVQAADGKLVAVEALLRWQHPTRGLCAPEEFIGMAEETGLIAEIGRWVLLEACRQAARWSEQQPPGIALRVAVNLSPRQLSTALLDTVSEALNEHNLPPEALCLEITEGLLITDTKTPVSVLHALKKLGVDLALDDFGTGYSSLAYLQQFPIDFLKLDQSFVNDLSRDQHQAIVRAMIDLSHSLGIPVIAEGVETAPQLDCLRSFGCDQVQGYLLGRPGPATLIDDRLASPHRLPAPAGTRRAREGPDHGSLDDPN